MMQLHVPTELQTMPPEDATLDALADAVVAALARQLDSTRAVQAATQAYAARVPCPTCSGTTWGTAGDRHARTRMDVCRMCDDTGTIPAANGTLPETSAPPHHEATLSYRSR